MLLTKRRRTESTRSNAPEPRKRTESTRTPSGLPELPPEVPRSDIWFDDGNLVVQAENTQFRLFKGTLCSSSEVFKDLVEEMDDLCVEDGTPLLLLSDSAVELTYVLRTIFHRWSYPPNQPLPFDVVAAFLRLGRKYAIKPLYDDALSRLTAVFPPSLTQYVDSKMSDHIQFPDPDDANRRGQIVIDTIILARELTVPALLPAAFWFAATRLESLAHPHTALLSEADRDRILLAAKPLSIAYATYLFGWLDPAATPANCANAAVCNDAKLKYSLKMWRPPGSAMTLYWRTSAAGGLCKACVAAGQKQHAEGVRRLWTELPAFFGLPPWAEMLADAPAAVAEYAVSRVAIADYATSRVALDSVLSDYTPSPSKAAPVVNGNNRRFTSMSTADVRSAPVESPSPQGKPTRFPRLRRAMSVFGGGK